MKHTIFRCRRAMLIVYIVGLCGCNKDPETRVADALRIPKADLQKLRRNTSVRLRDLEPTMIGDRPNPARAALPDLILESRHPDIPLYREAFWAMLHRDERGYIPPNGLIDAFQQKLQLGRRLSRNRFAVAGVPVGGSSGIPRTAGLNPNHTGWTELGPSTVGGRTRAIAVDPRNPQQMWVGSAGGGVWRSVDGGQTFVPVDDLMTNLVISTIVIDPLNSKVVYAGTGEGYSNLDSLRGAGIFRTTDGVSWKRLASTAGDDFQWVNRLAISPDGRTLLAATQTGIQISTDPDRANWQPTTLRAHIAEVQFHPSDNRKAIAAGMDTGNVYFSEDGGATWKTATHEGNWIHVWEDRPPTPSRAEITYAMANPNIVYASVDNNQGEIWRSTDGGKSYTKMAGIGPDDLPAIHLGGQGWYSNAIWAGDPKNADIFVVGGIDLWKSTDGGKTLVDISNWMWPQSVHADHHAIVSHPLYDGSSNRTVFLSNDGGVYVTTDITTAGSDKYRIQGWTHLNRKYNVTQFYGLALAPDGTLVAGAQDNGTLVLANGATPDHWEEMFGGDGGYCLSDPTDSKYLYGEYIQGNIHRRSEIGKPAEYISGLYWNPQQGPQGAWAWKGAPYEIIDAQSGSANFITPMALDPKNPARILVGANNLWQTMDAKTPNTTTTGPQWQPVKNPASTFISAVTIDSADSKRVWVGHNNGEVYMAANSLSTAPQWTRVDRGLLPQRVITRITIDPRNSNVVYVTFGGYSVGNVWKTTDGGLTWKNKAGPPFPKTPVYVLTVHPRNSAYVYAGTDVGVFASEDGGDHWSPGNEGPANCAVFDVVWLKNTLYAGTHGRGAFRIDLTTVPPGQ